MASASISWGGTNSDLYLYAKQAGTAGNVEVQFVNDAPQQGQETADYNPTLDTLTIHIVAGVSTAKNVIAAIQGDPASNAAFGVVLDDSHDPTNDGSGTVAAKTTFTAGGSAAVLTGTDANPQEAAGVFNSLLRLSNALQSGDTNEASRDIAQLQQASQNLSDCQAVLGAREQALSSAQTQLGSQNTQLQSLLSNDSDADLATVISELTARQTAYEASLETMAQMFKMTLLNYL
jgi:flagellin-like hook-associated protein FlgL